MNFLFLNTSRRWGGNEKWTRLAAHSLAENHGVWLAYRKKVIGERCSVPKIELPFLNELDLYTLAKLCGIIRRYSIDVLIPTKPKEYVLAGLAARLTGRKNIVRLGIVKNLGASLRHNLVFGKLAHGIIVNAAQIRETLMVSSFIRPDKVRVIYNGLDAAEIDAQVARTAGISRPFSFTICTLGELSGRKGVAEMLAGFAAFVKLAQAANAGLVVIGDGQDRPALEAQAQGLGIAKQVRFTGFLENPYLYLKFGDVYLTCSKNEGISNALLEAMYLGNAVVATGAGGTDYVIQDGHNGFLLPSADPAVVADRLAHLYRDENLRRQFTVNAQATIREKFSLTRMRNEIADFCGTIIAKKQK
jgi:glycosyltransferase involved in cell wall biosynthesis